MSLPTRRTILRRTTLGLASLAGCLDRLDGSVDSTPTPESCSASDPPSPTTAEASPKPYPERPEQLTNGTVRSYVRTYERAYQYNQQLAKNPDRIGRTNELDVSILETTVDSRGGRFEADVSGQLDFNIVDRSTTPSTPTRTPLPSGHRPFSASYVVTERMVRREGIVVECW